MTQIATGNKTVTTEKSAMKSTNSFALALALVLGVGAAASVGCAGSEVDDPNDVDDPDDTDGPVPTTAEGKYALTSQFDVASGLPGAVGDVVNGFIEFTDDPDDPAGALLDLAIAQIDNGTIRGALQGARTLAAGIINDRILDIAPDFVRNMVAIGNNVGQMARNFGTLTELDVKKAGSAYISTHTLTGMQFKIDNQTYPIHFLDYGLDNVVTQNVTVGLETTGKLTIQAHQVPLPIGKIFRVAIDELVIPQIDPLASDLGDVFRGIVDCNALGQAVFDAVDIATPSTYAGACNAGLEALGNLVYGQLNQLNGAMTFSINGTARAVDKNGDKKMDELKRGQWTGNVEYAGNPAPLTTATFAGTRM